MGVNEYNLKNLDDALVNVLADYKPFIEYIGNGLYIINAGRYSCVCSRDGAIEFDKALREAAKNYVYDGS
jgi:hypothetical protein